MPVHDDLGRRMKEFYETIPKTRLMRRCPVCCRLDGRSFHTVTKGFDRPFDEVFIKTMQNTMKYLCENVPGVVAGYVQSDEISLVLIDYKNLNTQAWFDYEVQKICSIGASMATMAFNRMFDKYVSEFCQNMLPELESSKYWDLVNAYNRACETGAMFDCRCFNIPKEEVTNYFYWRQLDATRNSIQMVGQANFSHKELQNKSCSDIQEMLWSQKGINWNDYPTYQKRGSCCVKQTYEENGVIRSRWVIDKEIPIFKGEDRKYIDELIYIGE